MNRADLTEAGGSVVGRSVVGGKCVLRGDCLGVVAGSSRAACGSSAGVTDAGSGVGC